MKKDGFEKGRQRHFCTHCEFRTAKTEVWFENVAYAYTLYLKGASISEMSRLTGLSRPTVSGWIRNNKLNYKQYLKEVNPFKKVSWINAKTKRLQLKITKCSDRYTFKTTEDSLVLLLDTKGNKNPLPVFKLYKWQLKKKGVTCTLELDEHFALSITTITREKGTWYRKRIKKGEDRIFHKVVVSKIISKAFPVETAQYLLDEY